MPLQLTTSDFFDDFDAPGLDLMRWIPVYLPQWASREATRPRYRLENSELVLTIEPDQQPWSPELNGPVRVSNLQTGVWSGPLGSARGQHVFAAGLRVREFQTSHQTYTPQYAHLEFRCRCQIGPSHVAALWMIGLEDEPERSAEICLFELKGTNIRSHSATVGTGIRAFADPLLTNEFFEDEFALDVTDWHTWSVDWRPGEVAFAVDGKVFRTVPQAPDYPMQLMLNLYDVEPAVPGTPAPEFRVDWVRGTSSISHR